MEYRQVRIPDMKMVERLIIETNRRVRSGKPIHRHYVAINTWIFAVYLKGKIPLDLKWPTDLVFPQLHWCAEALQPAWTAGVEALARSGDMTIEQALMEVAHGESHAVYLGIKSIEMSDVPNWFVPTPALAYSLMGTDLKGVMGADIKLPAPALFVEVPKGFFEMKSDRGIHGVSAIGVTTGKTQGKVGVIYKDGVREAPDVASRRLLVTMIRNPLPGDETIEDVSTFTFTIPLGGGPVWDLIAEDDSALDSVRTADRIKELDAEFWGCVFGRAVTRKELRDRVLNFIVNVLIYMTSRNATKAVRTQKPVKGKKARAREKRGGDLLRAKDWTVGTDVRIDPRTVGVIRRGGSRSRTSKTFVRGHYRNQAYGPRWSLRRQTWIEPHCRNLDVAGPISGHNYKGTSHDQQS